MDIQEAGSDVARLRAQIEAEHQAACLARGFAQTATHAFITARMNRITDYHRQLVGLIGDEAALHIVCDIFEEQSSG